MKKEIKVVVSIVLAVWFFFMGFEIGSYKEKKAQNTSAVPSQNVGQVDVPTVPTEPTTIENIITTVETITTTAADVTTGNTQNTPSSAVTTTEKANANTGKDPSAMSKDEILADMTKAINAVKAEQNMTAVRTETVTINLTDLSIPGAKNIINKIIQNLAGEEKFTYNFQNGQATGVDDKGKEDEDGVQSPNSAIPPKNEKFALTSDGVASASARKDGENTVYTVKLVEENTTFTAPVPKHNSAAFSYLDLTTIDVSGAEITDANMHYPGTEITATVNPAGKIIALHFVMPMDGNGAAKIVAFNGNATFEGSDDEAWTFTY